MLGASSRAHQAAAEGERTEGGKFSLDQFDSSDDEDGDGDSDDADDDARDAKMTKRLAKKKFLRKVKESIVSNDEGSKEKRSRRHAQRKRAVNQNRVSANAC